MYFITSSIIVQVVGGSVKVHHVPGDHKTFLLEDSGKQTAAILENVFFNTKRWSKIDLSYSSNTHWVVGGIVKWTVWVGTTRPSCFRILGNKEQPSGKCCDIKVWIARILEVFLQDEINIFYLWLGAGIAYISFSRLHTCSCCANL